MPKAYAISPQKDTDGAGEAPLQPGVAFTPRPPDIVEGAKERQSRDGPWTQNPKRASTSNIGRSSTMGGSSAASASAFARCARGNEAYASCAARVRTAPAWSLRA